MQNLNIVWEDLFKNILWKESGSVLVDFFFPLFVSKIDFYMFLTITRIKTSLLNVDILKYLISLFFEKNNTIKFSKENTIKESLKYH